MSCKEFVELVTDYLEGRLAEPRPERLEAHLGDCDGCASLPGADAGDARALGAAPEETISAEAREDSCTRSRDARAGDSRLTAESGGALRRRAAAADLATSASAC